jgi:hypothetical protein
MRQYRISVGKKIAKSGENTDGLHVEQENNNESGSLQTLKASYFDDYNLY